MSALLLIGIPIAVVILFWGIMTLPDEEVKNEVLDMDQSSVEKKKVKKSKRK